MAGIVRALSEIVEQGVRMGRFRPINPLLVHGGIVGPVLLYFASAGIRRRIGRIGVRAFRTIDRDDVVNHVQRVTLSLLQGGM